jgi:hypothetical protein
MEWSKIARRYNNTASVFMLFSDTAFSTILDDLIQGMSRNIIPAPCRWLASTVVV